MSDTQAHERQTNLPMIEDIKLQLRRVLMKTCVALTGLTLAFLLAPVW